VGGFILKRVLLKKVVIILCGGKCSIDEREYVMPIIEVGGFHIKGALEELRTCGELTEIRVFK